MPCQDHLVEVESALDGCDALPYAVMPAAPEALRPVVEALGLSMTVLSDPAWATHRALGMHRGGVVDVLFRPEIWAHYARSLGSGRVQRPQQNIWQLGGVVVADASGRIEWMHRSQDTTDYAPVEHIVGAVRRVRATGLRTADAHREDGRA